LTQRVAFVFQDPNLLPWRTVAANIALPLELRGIARGEQERSVSQSLALIGLTPDDARKRPQNLSGGMRMRVSLARALVARPDLLLFDEELVRIWLAHRWTALFVTHNVAEAVFLAQRVLVMTSRPGTIRADVAVPFAYPREPSLRADPAFARLCADLSQQLREAAG
jgi:NitT/TauT family transport system ATP-binding protein